MVLLRRLQHERPDDARLLITLCPNTPVSYKGSLFRCRTLTIFLSHICLVSKECKPWKGNGQREVAATTEVMQWMQSFAQEAILNCLLRLTASANTSKVVLYITNGIGLVIRTIHRIVLAFQIKIAAFTNVFTFGFLTHHSVARQCELL